jgi:ParB family chromosome partitioning protein
MEMLAAAAVRDGWSVRATEEAVRDGMPTKGEDKPAGKTGGMTQPPALKPAGLLELESLLAEFLDTKVGVSMSGKRGKVSIEFADLIDLERIYRRMTEAQ